MADFELVMARRRSHVDKLCGAEIGMSGCGSVDTTASDPSYDDCPADDVEPEVEVQGTSGNSSRKETIERLHQLPTKSSLNDMLLPDGGVSRSTEVEENHRRTASNFNSSFFNEHNDRINEILKTIQAEDQINDVLRVVPTKAYVQEQVNVVDNAIDDEMRNEDRECEQAPINELCIPGSLDESQISFIGCEDLNDDNENFAANANQFTKQASTRQLLRCMLEIEKSTRNESMVQHTTQRPKSTVNEDKPQSSRTPSNIGGERKRGLQRSASMIMMPSVSNNSNHGNLSRQASVRMMPNASISLRGSRSNKDRQLSRQSSAQVLPNVSSSSRGSNHGREISSKRDKLYRRSSLYVIQNASSVPRHSNHSTESFGNRVQRRSSLTMAQNAASVPRHSNHSTESFGGQVQRRRSSLNMAQNVSFVSRHSNSSIESFGGQVQRRRSSLNLVQNVSSASVQSNHSTESYGERLVQNVSSNSLQSNDSADSCVKKEKTSHGHTGSNPRRPIQRRVSQSIRQRSTRNLQKNNHTTFDDRVKNSSNELHPTKLFDKTDVENIEHLITSSNIPKDKSRAARPRRSSITLDTFFAAAQNDNEPNQQPDPERRISHDNVRLQQRRRASTGTTHVELE